MSAPRQPRLYLFPSEKIAAIVVMRLRQHHTDARVLPSRRGEQTVSISVNSDRADLDELVTRLDPLAAGPDNGECLPEPGTLATFLLARIAEDEDTARSFLGDQRTWVWSGERVLAECAAKRRIFAEHKPSKPPHSGQHCITCDDGSHSWPCHTLKALALSYAHHHDYQSNWYP